MRSEEKGGNLIVLSRDSKRGWKKSVTHLYYGNPTFLFRDKGKKEDPSVDNPDSNFSLQQACHKFVMTRVQVCHKFVMTSVQACSKLAAS
ncbi:hypothetical protein AVEN_162910-1 [Araneus ventricosus]|uniref:Uncharacterized protein n=1 Tax=Araneus ventricosus TaxID=182803 RepID=A0A4Y2FLN4_ARAVE|nr:hypothetical protein AVEN_162910-1 [Araneus ventricosus]